MGDLALPVAAASAEHLASAIKTTKATPGTVRSGGVVGAVVSVVTDDMDPNGPPLAATNESGGKLAGGARVQCENLPDGRWVVTSLLNAEASRQLGTVRDSTANVAFSYEVAAGSVIARGAYPDYYALVGTIDGAGDGTTTFGVWSGKGRTVVGVGTGAGLTARARGTDFGVETVTLTAGQSGVPAHFHSHSHTYGSQTSAPGGGPNIAALPNLGSGATSVSAVNNAAANAASSHENMPPSSPLYRFVTVL